MFSKARPGSASTLDLAKNSVETYTVEDGVGQSGEFIWWSPWDVDAAPSVSETLAVIHSLEGDWPYVPQEAPGPIGGPHTSAIGARILTPMIKWPVHASLSAGAKMDHYIESLDTVASNGRTGFTVYYSKNHGGRPTVFRKFTRETAVTAAGETVLSSSSPLTLPGAKQILEFIGILAPDGAPTADIETAGRFIVKSDSMAPINEVSWDIDPWEAIEATSGEMNWAQLSRQEVDLFTTVPSIVLTSSFDLDVVQTTQTAFGAIGASYLKPIPPNPLRR